MQFYVASVLLSVLHVVHVAQRCKISLLVFLLGVLILKVILGDASGSDASLDSCVMLNMNMNNIRL